MISDLKSIVKSLFIIRKIFIVNGTCEKLILKLKNIENKNMYIERIDKHHFKMHSKFSFGTGHLSSQSFLPIQVNVKIHPTTELKQKLEVYTFIRPENYLFSMAFIISTSLIWASQRSWKLVLITCGIYIVVTIWFNFIYKIQEESLIKIIKKSLLLKNHRDQIKEN